MKKVLLGLLLLLIPFTVNAKSKVKVYMFEAGGCPYCEMELEYLEGLDSYNKKFEIVKKELYIDHVNWEPGADFVTGVKVANAFLNIGFEDAAYNGTPFVVISDLYAAANYSTDLEKTINEAYEKGDKDIVGCIEKGKDGCLEGYKDDEATETANAVKEAFLEQMESQGTSSSATNYSTTAGEVNVTALIIIILSSVVVIGLVIAGVIYTNKKAK